MKIGKWFLVAAVLSACATMGNVRTDYDEKADFGKFKTYAFLEAKEINESGLLSNNLIRERVEGLLRENLDAEGLKSVSLEQNPDMVIQYWVGVKNKQDIASIPTNSTYYGAYYHDHWGTSYDRYVTYDYREGTLIVDLIDRESKNLVWRAYLVQVLEDSKDKNLETARRSLKKAFENYPPQAK
ncbi:MAG: hypothetical protein KCHDKBKB_01316 [Elusimicrobia bacterium]|nr:hypothetical protein [Elusimicrobiota bacterium]